MHYFETFTSNTLAGSGNQSFFRADPEQVYTGRVCYRLFAGGEYQYSILFSNTVDSTFADGKHSQCNRILETWELTQARVGIVSDCSPQSMAEPERFYPLTFQGKTSKTVMPGELFASDPVRLNPGEGAYLCLEVSFRGTQIPNHPETQLPAFRWNGSSWEPSNEIVFASMVGCDRPVCERIAFLGDSITQGIGVAPNSYCHWNAVTADILGEAYSFWNLGLGYARGQDAATDGAWLQKAKENDTVVVCFGVNDILQGYSAQQIKNALARITDALRERNIRVVLQTVPPFGYNDSQRRIWEEVNSFLFHELSSRAVLLFDVIPLLSQSEDAPHIPRFGGHPNEEGCRLWGEALAAELKKILS